jgi:hypothetical protein
VGTRVTARRSAIHGSRDHRIDRGRRPALAWTGRRATRQGRRKDCAERVDVTPCVDRAATPFFGRSIGCIRIVSRRPDHRGPVADAVVGQDPAVVGVDKNPGGSDSARDQTVTSEGISRAGYPVQDAETVCTR